MANEAVPAMFRSELRAAADPDREWVLEFVTRNSQPLSPLSRREAMKNLPAGSGQRVR